MYSSETVLRSHRYCVGTFAFSVHSLTLETLFYFHRYLIGTEDGIVHKCSCSYNEQTMHDYSGHEGPVYAIRWSPFVPGVFVTCSADWTLRIWREDKDEAVRVVTTGLHAIADCAWSPRASTVLVTVDEAGLSIWDFAVEELDPVASVAKGTVVTLSTATPTVAFGDTAGRITVGMLVTPLDVAELTAAEQASKLLTVLGMPSSHAYHHS